MALSMAALVNAKTPSSSLVVIAGKEEGIVAYGEQSLAHLIKLKPN